MKVYIAPKYSTPDNGEGGIRRVVEAMNKYLPEFGVDITGDITQADIINGHGILAPMVYGKPFVSSCHGLHWADYKWDNWAHQVNGEVITAMVQAQTITVPTHWVGNAITRGILRRPVVVHHGVDSAEWKHNGDYGNYVLWNKARVDPVSNCEDMQKVAEILKGRKFISTMGQDTENVNILGRLPLYDLKPIIQHAGVYLATARETFGIGTLEAMASGVPIVGWNYGGQEEIVINDYSGYLVNYGDYEGLALAIEKGFNNRDRLSKNCVDDVVKRWGWQDKIALYATVFKATHIDYENTRSGKVSVIVTSHNLGRYLADALNSVLRQNIINWECIIVDDDSNDDTRKVAEVFCEMDKRFIYLRTPSNLKLSGARNYGIAQSTGKYIINLDADDMLGETALIDLSSVLEEDTSIHIAYGSLDTISDDGSNRKRNPFPSGEFNWYYQMAHINQLHYAAMMRREVLVESAGYRDRMWRAEDAEFWCRVTSFGFKAQKVTDHATLIYRMRSDSKSAHEYKTFADKDGDWCNWFPWRIASTAQEGVQRMRESDQIPNARIVPFSAQGLPTVNRSLSWNAFHHQEPLVSVITPVGDGHKRYVIDALDSLVSQDFNSWEAIVVNDSHDNWATVEGAPYARVYNSNHSGPGEARNVGLKHARGKLVLFLDADDWLEPQGLRKMVEKYAEVGTGYIYSDYLEVDADWKAKPKLLSEYNQDEWRGQHAITILIAKQDALAVGAFDEQLKGWEDWEFFIKLAVNGICGTWLDFPAFGYRFKTGTRREESLSKKDKLLPLLKDKYGDFFDGVKDKMSCGCGAGGEVIIDIKRQINASFSTPVYTNLGDASVVTSNGITIPTEIRLEYIGVRKGASTYFGGNGRQYRGGNNNVERFVNANPEDVQKLVGTGDWELVDMKVRA